MLQLDTRRSSLFSGGEIDVLLGSPTTAASLDFSAGRCIYWCCSCWSVNMRWEIFSKDQSLGFVLLLAC